MQTCRIDEVNPAYEVINFDNDLFLTNIALLGLTALAGLVLMRKHIDLYKMDTKFITGIMLLLMTIMSLAWINLVQSVAGSDARTLLNTARDAAGGSYTNFYSTSEYYGNYSYYQYYPHRLGYVFFAEILYRVFGTESSDILFQIPNVIALDALYIGLVVLSKRIFHNSTVTNMTALGLIFCLQPMFMTTNPYGYLIGAALTVWSVYCTVRYIQENSLKHAGIAVLLTALAVVIYFNNIIPLAAICIALVLHTIDKKKLTALAVAAVMVFCSVGAQRLIIYSYAQRSETTLNTEISPTLYAYMGISNSTMAPGWYNSLAIQTLRDADMDLETANTVAKQGISNRLAQLSSEGSLADYIKKKFLSQLNEPSFESIWVSQVRGHNLNEGVELSKAVTSVYTGGLHEILDIWFAYYDMIIYFGFAAGMIWMIAKRKLDPGTVILPVTVLGGVLFHMIFEAKSQYMLPYFVFLIPYAMYGIYYTIKGLGRVTASIFKEPEYEAEA